MANYCASADVIRELPLIAITVATKPTIIETDAFCTDITADMDSRMRAVGIVVPVVDAEGLLVLKPIAINGVKAKVMRAKALETGDDGQAATYEELYQSAMGRIEERPSIIRDTDSPGQPEGTSRADDDIAFHRAGGDW